MAMWGAGIMVGPIIGPTLGGWLTESYNWRWVFLINLPVGALALLGCLAYLPKLPRKRRSFDMAGFALLSLGIGSLQLMLDRGGEVDWFSAVETWVYLLITISGFWMFCVHIQTNHAELGTFIQPYNPVLARAYPAAVAGDATTLQVLDGLVNVQSAMISYIDDFQLMMWVTLLAMPLALILRRPAKA
jgi:MFS family permease